MTLRLDPGLLTDKRSEMLYQQLQALLNELEKKEISDQTKDTINKQVEAMNSTSLKDKALSKLLKDKQTGILKMLEKEYKLVPKNYYRNMWLAAGLATFGVPIGIAFGFLLGNMAFLGIGLPIGMTIGMVLGASMDEKAAAEGRQLDVEIKY
ncbi:MULTISPECIES: hypothetical protein [Chryseobacterium]|uniref:F0F1-type ATP synthase assembly protein I n=1 Tax=Chryseobacterium camelliae TaxID=1265445 RepID=A0ABU0TII8_9FLAO|nr:MULTISPECIES: hypothetical protein [Chryseobacterium]MDT3406227.1 F0F1-type ATP synthase assembly protein I [Pseudacidovorax intermedius]MDQ1095973.1 F0F1-type ATP synthase assembly protein I [Chryseobacterium camelliae]MDQ1099909.1 F0F1-type ATP synthase assembly protein I [Chryseobacterium sp. SORGH_AS_1048]MDR6087255.1 F0F1-type ATP synthase assembly protein I [Chryseobacterium sp. SORGH_AS_0909]MDR6131629.1 F0F1-type ATP synthase assembly protein I [Chryseobacterium sp. SORGH_AS_1175]